MKTPYALMFMLCSLNIAQAGGMHHVYTDAVDGQTVDREPGPGRMDKYQTLYVNDGSCPAGQIKRVIGAGGPGQPRQRSCVVH